jgi:hypothetical protein
MVNTGQAEWTAAVSVSSARSFDLPIKRIPIVPAYRFGYAFFHRGHDFSLQPAISMAGFFVRTPVR